LRTRILPVFDASQFDAQAFLGAGGDRIIETDALDEAAIAAIARIGRDEVVKRAVLSATAGKSKNDHVCPSEFVAIA
jgi:hypothetical protein